MHYFLLILMGLSKMNTSQKGNLLETLVKRVISEDQNVQTSLSKIEVVLVFENGNLFYLLYPFVQISQYQQCLLFFIMMSLKNLISMSFFTVSAFSITFNTSILRKLIKISLKTSNKYMTIGLSIRKPRTKQIQFFWMYFKNLSFTMIKKICTCSF